MGNTNSRKPRKQPPPPPPLAAEEEEAAEATESEISNFTCEICIEPMLSNKKFRNNGVCVHPFCVDCIIKFIQVKIEEDQVGEIKCPGLNCDQLLDPLTCRPLMSPQLFEKWSDVLCERAVLGLERCYCPNRDCSALVVNECSRGLVKKSNCPNCKRPFCFHCGVPWHAGYRCEEGGEMRDRYDVAFGVLAERKKWMRCPNCNHFVELVEGCSIVKCRCGRRFCYNCGRNVHRQGCNCSGNINYMWRVWLYRISLIILITVLLFFLLSLVTDYLSH